MKKILVVLSSVRESRIADNILATVQKQLGDYEVTVADFKEMPLPFFDAPLTPSNEHFTATDPNVIKWANMVEASDAVVMLVAEYNYSFTAVLKNAIDWVFKPWSGKPVAMIGYGWAGGSRAIAQLRDVLGSLIGAKAMESEANLHFMKEIDLEGNVTDEEAVNTSINATLEELKLTLG
jgi:NAD(P)H-dependent FMN reductase